jgi:D-sedoheptulose 7-phosphate isomerase
MRSVDLPRESAELQHVVQSIGAEFHAQVQRAAVIIEETFRTGGTVLVCGNGGSAAEAQHFSDEMLGRYKTNRPSYPVVSLTADSAAITCIGNDFGFDDVFARQVDGLGKAGDVLVALSTSGTSRNILRAVERAREKNMKVVALTGRKGTLRERADVAIESPSDTTARIQELHLHAIHLLSEFFEPG